MEITQNLLKQHFSYDPGTGVFIRLPKENNDPWNTQWAGKRAGSTSDRGYRQIYFCGKAYFEHRLAWLYVHGAWPVKYLDHIDNNPANNAISNLREINHQNNLARASSKNPLGKGISQVGNRFRACISKDRKHYYLGTFSTPEGARKAYYEKAKELWGEFAD